MTHLAGDRSHWLLFIRARATNWTFLGIPVIIVMLVLAGCGAPRYVKPTPRLTEPPPGKALVNIHWWHRKPVDAGWPLFEGQGRLVGMLRSHTLYQDVVEPGEHIYLARAGVDDYSAAILVDVAAGRTYDVLGDWETAWSSVSSYLNWGSAGVRIFLYPVPAEGERRQEVINNENDQRVVRIDRSDPSVVTLEQQYTSPNKAVIEAFRSGNLRDQLQHLTKDQCRR